MGLSAHGPVWEGSRSVSPNERVHVRGPESGHTWPTSESVHTSALWVSAHAPLWEWEHTLVPEDIPLRMCVRLVNVNICVGKRGSEYEWILGWSRDTRTPVSLGTNVYSPEFTHVCAHVHLRLGEPGHMVNVAALNMCTCICDPKTSVSGRKSEHMRRTLRFHHVSVLCRWIYAHVCACEPSVDVEF